MCANMCFKMRAFAVSFVTPRKSTDVGPFWLRCTIFSWSVSWQFPGVHWYPDARYSSSHCGHNGGSCVPTCGNLFILLVITICCLNSCCYSNLFWTAVSHFNFYEITVTDRRLCFRHGDKALGCQASINVHTATGTNTHIRQRRRYRRRRLRSAWRRRTTETIRF